MIFLSLSLLIISSYTDLRERGISLMLLAVSLISCIALMTGVEIYGNSTGLPEWIILYEPKMMNILAALLPGLFLFIVHRISEGSIGKGDVYVVLILGLMLGLYNTGVLLMMSMVFTAVIGLICMKLKGIGRKAALPFMPFLLSAHVVQIVFMHI